MFLVQGSKTGNAIKGQKKIAALFQIEVSSPGFVTTPSVDVVVTKLINTSVDMVVTIALDPLLDVREVVLVYIVI